MQKHINQAEHNSEFLKQLNENFPYEYFDWKITVVFYCSLHLMRAYASFLGIDSGNSHKDFWDSVRNSDGSNKLDDKLINNYKAIYRYCRNARYDGFINSENFEKICKTNYSHSHNLLAKIKIFVNQEIN